MPLSTLQLGAGQSPARSELQLPASCAARGKQAATVEKEGRGDTKPEPAAPLFEAVSHLFPPAASAASALTQGRVTAARSGAGREGQSWRRRRRQRGQRRRWRGPQKRWCCQLGRRRNGRPGVGGEWSGRGILSRAGKGFVFVECEAWCAAAAATAAAGR